MKVEGWRVAPAGMWSAVALSGSRASGLKVEGWCSVCHALWNFCGTWQCVRLAGVEHCAEPILRAKNVGLVGLVGLVGRLVLGVVCAMRCGILKAHGSQRAMCQLSIMSIMSIMSIYTAHSMCIALCAPPAGGFRPALCQSGASALRSASLKAPGRR